MRKSWRMLAGGAAMALTWTLVACGESTVGVDSASGDDCIVTPGQGVTDDTIKLGSTMPLSGQAAGGGISVQVGMQAYADYINDQGGVKGSDGKTRMIELIIYDDAAVPSKAISNIDKLIREDEVFSIVGLWGTASNIAARSPLDKACMPSIWPMTGGLETGNPAYKWQPGGVLPNYLAEGVNIAKYITEQKPSAKVAVLQQNDDVGAVLAAGFDKGIEGSDIEIVERQTFESNAPDLSSQATTLAASQADVFLYLGSGGTTQTLALQRVGETAWKPEIRYVSNFSSLFVNPLPKDLQEGIYHNDNMLPIDDTSQAMQTYLEWVKKNTDGVKQAGLEAPRMGWAIMQLTTETFKTMPTLDQQVLIQTLQKFATPEGFQTVYRVGGDISINWPSEPYPVMSTALNRWNAETQKSELIEIMRPNIPITYEDLTKK